ncbi:Tetratricopeptide repeat-containing protein [Nitrosomonas eutropha]|uniref:tetratricopeptide repeat protein n=1 Tax=Nitrosomonas eutropha TaxID=916 RepID=UPI0008817CCB|nr:tetratricopeptide repeat protein [Nitrosomonas eutropha]SCX03235.1 Tetratricopeptide repeat-containing protein [Nitrosomonas eutropha]
MNVILTILLATLLGVAGCTQLPKTGNKVMGDSEAPENAAPVTELTADLLFDFLQGEIALQRNQPGVAVESFIRMAKETRDPGIAEHATDIALRARRFDNAREAIDLWATLEPNSIQAHQAAVALFVATGQLNKVRPHIERLLVLEPETVDKAFMQLNKLLSHHPDKEAVLKLIRQLAAPYPDLPEAHFAVSQAAWVARQFKSASEAMSQALKLRPEWEMAAVHQGQILQKIDTDKAQAFYSQYLDRFPRANDMRIAYIRMLMEEKEFDRGREQFQKLEQANPSNPDIALAIGLLSAELDDLENAEKYFKRALQLGFEDADTIHFNLGRIYEISQRDAQAMDAYQKVASGDRYIPAHVRYAYLLAKRDSVVAARHYLKTIQVSDERQRTQLLISEAQLLRDNNDFRGAYDLLDAYLRKYPEQVELLYDRALMADKIGKLDVLERDLRRLIQLKPDNAHAYNALGYSLAERGEQLPEALALVQKAIELSPDDPYILDSLGWVYYRMGDPRKGIKYIKLAFDTRSDPEIAAHYGELLWVSGARQDAEKIWQTALEDHPENELLLDTIRRFMK